MVGLGRVELPTYGLGNRRSIHLSYSPDIPIYTRFTRPLHAGYVVKSSSMAPPRELKPGIGAGMYEVLRELIPEAFALFLLLLIVGGAEKLLRWLIGDYKFFDYLPVRWVFDIGDLTVILLFIWRNVRKFFA